MKLTACQIASLVCLGAHHTTQAKAAEHAASLCDPHIAEEFRMKAAGHAAWAQLADYIVANARREASPTAKKTLRLHVVEGGRS